MVTNGFAFIIGGFTLAYECLCDYHGQRALAEVIWVHAYNFLFFILCLFLFQCALFTDVVLFKVLFEDAFPSFEKLFLVAFLLLNHQFFVFIDV